MIIDDKQLLMSETSHDLFCGNIHFFNLLFLDNDQH